MANKLALTCGDPAGVGPEIIAAWLAEHPAEAAEVAVIGPADWLGSLKTSAEKISVGEPGFVIRSGQPSEEGARVAWLAMEQAAQGCQRGEYTGVVTGPVSKAELAKIGYAFPGQTEFFAAQWGGEPVMCFAGGKLCLALATWHVPLHQVARFLGPHLLHRTVQAADTLARAQGIAQPRIGVCGLNPHAGEEGLIGGEERDFINPSLVKMQAEFPRLSLCQPGDTIFARQLRGEFDVVVALYHDQGLGPLKTVDFDDAVNITMGLPFVRTSPDHGTAFGIAGQGRASARSFTNAVRLARDLIKSRSRQ